jgi:hypothetical protein
MFGMSRASNNFKPSSPAKAGDPVRRSLTAQLTLALEYWIARPSRAMTVVGLADSRNRGWS